MDEKELDEALIVDNFLILTTEMEKQDQNEDGESE